MPIITLLESSPGTLNYLLQPLNYTQLYNKLKTILSAEEMLLFSRPDIYDASTNWSADLPSGYTRSQLQLYSSMVAQDRLNVEQKISQLKESITRKLSTNKDLTAISETFFKIPSDEDIYVFNIGGINFPIFSRWGCSLVNVPLDTNPLSKVLEKFNLPTSDVTLAFRFSNGRVASEYLFLYSFSGKESVQKTDNEGFFKLGKIRSGTSFSVFEIRNNNKGEGFDFVAMEGQMYSVVIPAYTNRSVVVKDQNEKLLSNKTISVFHNGTLSEYMTDSHGKILLNGLRVGREITFSDIQNPANKATHEVKESDAHFVFILKQNIPTNVNISVQDSNKTKLANYPILIKIGDAQAIEYKTNSDGSFKIENCVPGSAINITDVNKLDNKIDYVLQEGENDFLLFSDFNSSSQFIRVRLLNNRNEPIPKIPVKINYRNQLTDFVTDKNGEFALPKNTFIDESKVSASITTQKVDKKGNLIDKLIQKDFTYTSNKDLYIIKLNRVSKWLWLLLLLLLPLLLLIRFDKTIYVKYQNSTNTAIETDAKVYLSYHRQMAYDSGTFFTDNFKEYIEKTDKRGVAGFAKLDYSLYSYLFHYGSPLKVFVDSDCYENDTLQLKFHAVSNNDTIKVIGKPRMVYIDFRVVDAITDLPLRHSKVRIIAQDGDFKVVDSAFSNKDGIVGFKVPKCGNINWSIGTKAGYLPDSIINKSVYDLVSDELDLIRKLRLTPIEGNQIDTSIIEYDEDYGKEYENINHDEIKPPKKDCQVFFSGCFVSDEFVENNVSKIYDVDENSEYVGEGAYPDCSEAFPKATLHTFDGIAIDKGTRVIIYSKKNFHGDILLNVQGPVIINNGNRINENYYAYKPILDRINTKTFKGKLQENFPQSCRKLSSTDMIQWSDGSLKIICDQ